MCCHVKMCYTPMTSRVNLVHFLKFILYNLAYVFISYLLFNKGNKAMIKWSSFRCTLRETWPNHVSHLCWHRNSINRDSHWCGSFLEGLLVVLTQHFLSSTFKSLITMNTNPITSIFNEICMNGITEVCIFLLVSIM